MISGPPPSSFVIARHILDRRSSNGTKMAGNIRNSDWEDDEQLKSDIQHYVLQNLRSREILDFVRRDFPEYAWSLGTLSRRMAFFGIQYIKYDTDIKDD